MTTRMMMEGWHVRSTVSALALVASSGANAIQSRYNLAPPVSPIAHDINWLHWLMLVICGVIFIAVFSVMFYSIWKHRKSKGAQSATWHENTTVEVVWTVIPFIIVIVMALPATKTVVAMKDTSNADLTIKATGYQWQWGYDYIRGEGEGISLLSQLATPRDQIEGDAHAAQRAANPLYLLAVTQPLVVPVNKKIRVITTANDVIHAWWVPAFGVKQDAIPGFARDAWFRAEKVGTYYGQCAELCGKDHAFMPIAVEVVTAEQYTTWVDGQKKAMAAAADDPAKTWDLAELKTRGAQVYAANCQVCHQANGQGVPGTFPALAGSKVALSPQKADIINLVLHGKNAMPAWGPNLSDTEIAAVTTFVENNFGNATGNVIQPAEVKALRK